MGKELASLVSRGIEYAMSRIERDYEKNSCAQNNRPFHVRNHTLDVIRRAVMLAHAMSLPERQTQLVMLAAAWHDVLVVWPSRNGNNEFNSAACLSQWICQHDTEKMFSEEERRWMYDAIIATFVATDQQLGAVFQPHLQPSSHPVVRCVALADLGTAGMDGSLFLKEGDLRFREGNLDISVAINSALHGGEIPLSDQYDYKARMLAWMHLQRKFIQDRQDRLELELGNLDDSKKQCVRALFCRFGDATRVIESAVTQRQQQNFWEIAQAMGYQIPG